MKQKQPSKRRLVLATVMIACIFCSPVYAEEPQQVTAEVEIAEVAPAPTTPEANLAESTEAIQPVEPAETAETIDVTEPAEIVEIVEGTETAEDAEAATTPTLLVDRLAPETYAELTDPNARIVLIDISDQYLWAFENGVAVLESPMISGTANTRRETSRGIFQIELKKPGKYLRGPKDANGNPKWNCWVDYWMLFDRSRAIGLHDASWRDISQYDGQTYLTNGSHGCVNLPCDFAPLLYDFVEVGTPVIVQD